MYFTGNVVPACLLRWVVACPLATSLAAAGNCPLPADISDETHHVLLLQVGVPALLKRSRSPQTNVGNSNAWQESGDVRWPLFRNRSQETAAQLLKMKHNQFGDITAFLTAVVFNTMVFLVLVAIFCVLRLRFPLVFTFNANTIETFAADGLTRTAFPPKAKDSYLAWISASLKVSIEDVELNVGLDAAMLLEFTHLSMKLCAVIGMPMCFVMCPVHRVFGGMPEKEVDKLSRIGMANIRVSSPLYWLHAFIVVFVVLVANCMIQKTMRKFLGLRWKWLKSMPSPRSTTVLVENIPSSTCADKDLREYFGKMFGSDKIKEVYVVRRTDRLQRLMNDLDTCRTLKDEANGEWEENGCAEDARPTHYALSKGHVDTIKYYEEQEQQLVEQTRSETDRLQEGSDRTALATCAFVTFNERRDAEIALNIKYNENAELYRASTAPDPADIRWSDLKLSSTGQVAKQRLGYLCVIGIYLAYIPILGLIDSLISVEHVRSKVPAVQSFLNEHPGMVPAIEGVFASLALTIFLSFLPTFFMFIFDNFFILKAEAWAQHKLQRWYFWFMVVFILFAPVLGNSLIRVSREIAENPFDAAGLLADAMPQSSHFYLNFMVMQWVTHGLNITRYIQLTKYLCLRTACDPERAKELSEPEDQDYYGIGARSARFSINMVIALVFCSVSPLISALTFVNFFICRLVYGYLLVFSETRKPDLGGNFFVTQLYHVQVGLALYTLLMLGVLARRSDGWNGLPGPMWLPFGVLIYHVITVQRFWRVFQWETLPFEEIISDGDHTKRASAKAVFKQPEMMMSDA